jgi:hypothetical protein
MTDKRPDANDLLRTEGNDGVRRAFDDAVSNKSNGGAADLHFKLKRFDEISASTSLNYLIKGLLPSEGLIVIWGPPKCGKSFITFDMAMHIALGWKYRGRKVRQGVIAYLALEGGQGFRNRIDAWRQRHLAGHHGAVPFYLLDKLVDLIADHSKLIEDIAVQLGDQRSAAIVIDTLNRALIGDENNPKDMAQFIRAADLIRAAFGCAVIVIHHCGIAGSRPRGHTSLTAACDAQIAVERDDSGVITVKVEHMKDADASAPMASRLEHVELGNDDDGDPLTSCVVVPADDAAAAGAKQSKATGAAQLALDQLRELIVSDGEPAPASNHIPPHVRVVSAVLWRECFYKAHAGSKPDTKQKSFVRAVTRLQELHLVGLWGDQAWLTDKPDITRQTGNVR